MKLNPILPITICFGTTQCTTDAYSHSTHYTLLSGSRVKQNALVRWLLSPQTHICSNWCGYRRDRTILKLNHGREHQRGGGAGRSGLSTSYSSLQQGLTNSDRTTVRAFSPAWTWSVNRSSGRIGGGRSVYLREGSSVEHLYPTHAGNWKFWSGGGGGGGLS